MLSPLPPEILDLIVHFLHDDLGALKACCIVSKSWVYRTRERLFAHVQFTSKSPFKLWQKTFPDPSNSPAHHVRNLSIRTSEAVPPADTSVGDWIRTFSGVVRLHVEIFGLGRDISLAPLRGLSPSLRSLRMDYGSSIRPSEIFGLVCSFPLLEDLALVSLYSNCDVGRLGIPSTSPKLTGCLDLRTTNEIRPIVRQLLELPSGLHFSKIYLSCLEEDVESMTDMVSRCSDTLESLNIHYNCSGAVFLSASRLANTLPVPFGVANPGMPLVDLSKLTKLKDVVFGCPDIQRITMTLQTAESTNLEQITIIYPIDFGQVIMESAYREWKDLDRLLLQFWVSYSIRPKIRYEQWNERRDLRDVAPRLLPELTSRGAVDLIKVDGFL